jgi:predicted RNA polymerase sigma factor
LIRDAVHRGWVQHLHHSERTAAGEDLVRRLRSGHHRLHGVRAHLLELGGDPGAAVAACRTAAQYAANIRERRYLEARAASLAPADEAAT